MTGNKQSATQLSRELRNGSSKELRHRRAIVALSLTASASMGLIALYQMGIIKHLPEPPLPRMNADQVDASAEAYEMLRTPDAVLGLGSYAATMGLAAMGGSDRSHDMPLIPLALALKIGFDAVNAARLSVDQWTKHRAFCFWCLLASAATFAMVPLAMREASVALRAISTDRRP